MSVSGKVISVSPDWRGSVLAVATTTGTTVLTVDDATDFDEDGGWLVISDETTPREYLSVDPDAETITLAAAVGAVFDDTQPVVVWDPDVKGGGARVREDVAEVMLPDSEQAVLATLKHEQVPTAGIDSLIGATVLLEDEDGDDATTDWYVASVLGREATMDGGTLLNESVPLLAVNTPYIRVYKATNQPIDHATVTSVTDFTVAASRDMDPPVSGWFPIAATGLYLLVFSAAWAANSTGARYVQIVSRDAAMVESVERQVAIPTQSGATVVVQAVDQIALQAGTSVQMRVQQTSGAVLDLAGAANGKLTGASITQLSVIA